MGGRGVVVGLFLLMMAARCGGHGNLANCTAGDVKSCTGPSACAGSQTCEADGTYGTCACGGGGAGGTGATDGGAATCDPLTQTRDSDGAPACGSPDPSNPTLGCYGAPDLPSFTCQPVVFPDNKSDARTAGGSGPRPAPTSCAPGYLPLLKQQTGSDALICVALCGPGPTSLQMPGNAGGVSPYTCAAAGAGGTHECRYWWNVELDGKPAALRGGPHLNSFSNTLGYCEDYSKYWSLSQSGNVPDPSCTTLSSTTFTYDTSGKLPDNAYWGCAPYPTQ